MTGKHRGALRLKSWRMWELRSITLVASVLGRWICSLIDKSLSNMAPSN